MSESKKYLCEEADNVTRFEVIGLSIMAYLDTHVKHDNRSVCRGVSLKDAREWIREQIKRNTPSDDLDGEISQFIDKMDLENNGRWSEEDIIACAEHFANWQKERMMKEAYVESRLVEDGRIELEGSPLPCLNPIILLPYPQFKPNDKVKVIIVKED